MQNSAVKMGYVWTICLVAACGGLLFGYDWVVIGGAKPFYEAYFHITDPAQSGWAMSSALTGCIFGALVSGWCADKFGRRLPLIASAILFSASAWGTAMAGSFDMFVVYRIVGGVGIGLASALSPLYIAEVSPAEKRGRFVAINQLTIVIGVLAAQLINLLIAEPVVAGASQQALLDSWNGQTGWRWMFGAELVPALAFLLLLFVVPESPRWLMKAGKEARARLTLERIGSPAYATQTLNDIAHTLAKDTQRVSFAMLLQPNIRPVVIMGMVLAVFQQWCGINVIFNYAQAIFASAGFDINGTLKSIVATGIINLIFTLAALPLVDKIGRRKLMQLGACGLTVIYMLIAGAYALGIMGWPVLLLVLAAIAIYALTLAPVTWVLLSEIFPNRVRGLAMSLGTLALWIACFLLTYTFPLLNASLGASGSFLLYGIICAIGWIYIQRTVPETKGVTLEALEEQLTGRPDPTSAAKVGEGKRMTEKLWLENAHLRMSVSPQGGCVLSLDSLDHQQPVLRAGKGTSPGDCGLFPMLPLANRVEGNGFTLHGYGIQLPESLADAQFFLHGDGWLAPWQIAEQSREHCILHLRQRHACGFDYQAELVYRLQGNALEIELTLTHLGEHPMLYGGGVHPFFHFTPQSRIQFAASGYWPEGPSHLPLSWTDDLPAAADFSEAQYGAPDWLNVCYSGWNGRATILHEQMTVTLRAPTNWLMLFRMPDEPFVCLEPQSHPVNAHRMPGQPGVVLLMPKETWRFSTSILVNESDGC